MERSVVSVAKKEEILLINRNIFKSTLNSKSKNFELNAMKVKSISKIIFCIGVCWLVGPISWFGYFIGQIDFLNDKSISFLIHIDDSQFES